MGARCGERGGGLGCRQGGGRGGGVDEGGEGGENGLEEEGPGDTGSDLGSRICGLTGCIFIVEHR